MLAKKELDKANNEEIIKMKKVEIKENKESISKNNKNDNTIKKIDKRPQKVLYSEVKKEIDIEDNYYSHLCNRYRNRFRFAKEVRIPGSSFIFDIVAISRDHSFDGIYELKTWDDVPNDKLISTTYGKMLTYSRLYEDWRKINCRCKLVVFTKKSNIEKMEKALAKHGSNLLIRFHVEIYDVNDFIKHDDRK